MQKLWTAVMLAGGCAQLVAAQPAPQKISILNLVQSMRDIRFDLQNNHTSPITFWQVRVHAACPDGRVADAGGWSSDALRTIAAGPDADLFAVMHIEPIAPGASKQFVFPAPLVVSSDAGECEPGKLRDVSVIFADGTGEGSAELIAAHVAELRIESETLKRWTGAIGELAGADDPMEALKALRTRLDDDYDDCEGRPLQKDELVRCGELNRELRQSVNEQLTRMRHGSETAASNRERLERMVGFWQRFAGLLETASNRGTIQTPQQ